MEFAGRKKFRIFAALGMGSIHHVSNMLTENRRNKAEDRRRSIRHAPDRSHTRRPLPRSNPRRRALAHDMTA